LTKPDKLKEEELLFVPNNNEVTTKANTMEAIMQKIRDDLKKTESVKENSNPQNLNFQSIPLTAEIKLGKLEEDEEEFQIVTPQTFISNNNELSTEANKIEDIMKKIREDLNKNTVTELTTPSNIQLFKEENIQSLPTSIPVSFSTETLKGSENMADIMSKIREDLQKLNKEPITETKDSNNILKTMEKIREDLKIAEEKPKNENFHSLAFSVTKPDTLVEENNVNKMNDIMKKIRDDLKKSEDKNKLEFESSILPPVQPVFSQPSLPSITNQADISQVESVEDIMKKIREDIQNINNEPTIAPLTKINQVSSENTDNTQMSDIMKKIREDLLKEDSGIESKPKSVFSQPQVQNTNTQQTSLKETMDNIMKAIRDDLKTNNPESNQKLILKDDFIKSDKSIISSTHSPAESMQDIMAKIREDLFSSTEDPADGSLLDFATNQGEVAGGMLDIMDKIRKGLNTAEDEDSVPGLAIQERIFSTSEPRTEGFMVDFMGQVDLMKENVVDFITARSR